MKTAFYVSIIIVLMPFILNDMFIISPRAANIDTSELSGDTKSACEAILCLSSSTRPGECSPSLNQYFNITRKKWSDTLNARKAFLNLCPAASEEGMPSLVDAIANGAGKCDAAALNSRTIPLFRLYDVYQQVWSSGWQQGTTAYQYCTDNDFAGRRYNSWYNDDDYRYCKETRTIIDSSLPGECGTYINHGYTDLGVRFVGNPYEGGRWVD